MESLFSHDPSKWPWTSLFYCPSCSPVHLLPSSVVNSCDEDELKQNDDAFQPNVQKAVCVANLLSSIMPWESTEYIACIFLVIHMIA